MKRSRILFALSAALLAAVLLFSCTVPQEETPSGGFFPETGTFSVVLDAQNGSSPTTVSVEEGMTVAPPDTPVRPGYTFGGWCLKRGEETRLWSFATDRVTESMTLFAVWTPTPPERIPAIYIDTEGAEITSKEDYVEMTFTMEGCDDALADVTGGIRLRGNSTMAYDKKPYRIKFDKKQSLFGLEKAKSWVLLAEYLDPSALHNYTAFSIASGMPGLSFTPTPHKVNLYLNGEFKGLYTLCEQVQENEGRMDIEMEEITEEMTDLFDFNFFVCMDHSAAADPTAVLNETYFYNEKYDRYFELKYPEKGAFASDAQFESFFAQLQAYVEETMDAFAEDDLAWISEHVNVDSLADYLIVDQIMGEEDHTWKSFNMYYANSSAREAEVGKLSFGPVWDYDTCLYTTWDGAPNDSFEISDRVAYSNLFFQTMAGNPELFDVVKERYALYGRSALLSYLEEYDAIAASLEISVDLNHALWYAALDTELSKDNVAFLKAYLENRVRVLDEAFGYEEN